jgi:aryl-alcohol dehydrogenase-like predicted oxidoreductase
MDQPFPTSALPADLSRYVYGTTRLGDQAIPVPERVRIAREAMAAGVWFHASEQYGDALCILGKAFDEDRAHVPKLVVKLGNESVAEIRATLQRNIGPLGVDRVDLGQLCLGGELAEDFARGGQCYEGLRALQEEGLVGHWVVEVFPWTSDVTLRALEAGHADRLVGGCIFYLNPLQRFASNPLWDVIRSRRVPVIAMRTVAGGNVHRLRDVPGAAWKEYLRQRAVEVAPIFERSGIGRWSEFCVRFAHSIPGVRATVGATSRSEALAEFLAAGTGDIAPLPEDVVEELLALQRRWSSETDVHAEPWSM